MRRTLPLVLAFTLAAACGDTTTTPMPDGGGLPDLAADGPESGDAGNPIPPATTAVITSTASDFQTGALNTVTLADRKVTTAIDTTLDGDNGVSCVRGVCYVLNRTHGTVRLYDEKTWKATAEIKTGDATHPAAMSNPHGVYPLNTTTKLYVLLYGNKAANSVGVIDTSKPDQGVAKWIALPLADGDTDGSPEPNGIHFCGGLLYVLLEDLVNFKPVKNGRVAVIDPTTDTLVGTPFDMQGRNPFDFTVEGNGCDRLLVADADDSFRDVAGKGGIERLDLSLKKSAGMVVTDTALGGHPLSVAFASPALAYVVVGGASGQLVTVDPTAGKLVGAVSAMVGYMPFVRATPDRKQVYLGVGTGDMAKTMPAGVYVAPADGSKVGGAPLDLKQAPNDISFY